MLTEFLIRLAISVLLLAYFSYSGFFKQVAVRRFALMIVVFCVLFFGSMLPVNNFLQSSFNSPSPLYDLVAVMYASILSWLFFYKRKIGVSYTLLCIFFLCISWHIFFLFYGASFVAISSILGIGL